MDTPDRTCFAVIKRILLILMISLAPVPSMAMQNARLVVLPFEIVDNTPVPGGVERNQKMLDKLTRYISQKISQEGIFNVIAQSEVNRMVKDAQLGTYIHTCNLCEYDLAKKAGGDRVMVGWIYKMSILVLTLHIEVKDVEREQTLIRKAYDFRGDNEKAWLRAAKYMIRDLQQMVE
jgi:hypothetical protein